MRTMFQVWEDKKGDIASPEATRAFDEKLRREWAVHTGLIERIYALDIGVTEMLIERGIEEALIPHRPGRQLPEITAAIINDHKNVVDGLFDFVADRRQITTSYIKELHAALVQNQHTATGVDKDGNRREVPLIKGDYKKHPNNPTRPDGKLHEYCPPEHVNSEMDNLIKMHGEHADKGIAPAVSAAWLHHRFTQIHPFQDGNGRVARCLATIIFLRARGFPLTIRDINGERTKYIDALEAADSGNLQPLVSVFVASQQREFTRAVNISREISEDIPQDTGASLQERTAQIAKSAAQKIAAQQNRQAADSGNTQRIAEEAHSVSVQMLIDIKDTLYENIPPHQTGNTFRVDYTGRKSGDIDYNFLYKIDEVAAEFGYEINPRAYHKWARLILSPESNHTEIVVSIHGVGKEYMGVLFCSACLFSYQAVEAGARVSPAVSLTDEAFQINYQDSADSAVKKFHSWVEKAIQRGLAIWHESL